MAVSKLLARDLLGAEDPATIQHVLDGWCHRHLDAGVTHVLFARSGVGYVAGLHLQDGRRVVVKAAVGSKIDRLRAVQQVQEALNCAGFPAPCPVGSPAPLGTGTGAAEELVDRGAMPDGHGADDRRLLAGELARVISLCRTTPPHVRQALRSALPPWVQLPRESLWPRPHDLRVDMTAPGNGSELIDTLAAEAKRCLLARVSSAPSVVGHADWEAQNLRVEAGALAVAYDWDSLAVAPEAVLAGMASTVFTSQPVSGAGDVPTPAEQDGFLEDYQSARGKPFDREEISLAVAAGAWVCAYNARVQYWFLRRAPRPDGGFHLDVIAPMLHRLRRHTA